MPAPKPPTGIRSIEISSFRRIDSLRLDFTGADGGPSDIVILAGPNGCGKTSVLEACLVALGYDDELQGGLGQESVHAGRSHWTISAQVTTPLGNYSIVCRSDRIPKWVRDGHPEAVAPLAQPCLYFSSWRAPKLVGAQPITAGKGGKPPADIERNRIWRTKRYLINSKAHQLMSPAAEDAPDPYFEAVARLGQMWTLFHPGEDQHFSVEPVGRDPDSGFDVFLRGAGGQRVPVDALSSGQLELFAIFGSLMLAKFDHGLVAIDEPELHLDPQWHGLMLRAIRRFLPNAQIIVATHSPRMYDSVMSFQRHLLVSETDPRARPWKAQAAGAAGA